jgi:hypothetical protein
LPKAHDELCDFVAARMRHDVASQPRVNVEIASDTSTTADKTMFVAR